MFSRLWQRHVCSHGPLRHTVRASAAVRRVRAMALYPGSSQTVSAEDISYLTQEQAVKVDEQLMGPLGFSVDQLMELAGLSVACAVAAEAPASARTLVLAGPGNNGGDGLVAARHLHHFGHHVQICYPKQTDRPLYRGLITQCQSLRLPFIETSDVEALDLRDFDVVIDALFGFSFSGTPRPPFDTILRKLASSASGCLLASVDIPSGWHVENGPAGDGALQPDLLVSLTAPKLSAKHFEGVHYLGGRFVPPEIASEFKLKLPPYPGTAMCVKISGGEARKKKVADMRLSDTDLTGGLTEDAVLRDPFQQFDAWMQDAAALRGLKEPNAMSLATCAGGNPSNRMVLLKGYSADEGFVFYSNYDSRKASELADGASAALCMFWEPLNRQVRVEGRVERLGEESSTAYFHSRPRSSQIGAWCSHQSSVIPNRQALEDRLNELQAEHSDESVPIPKPPFWGGYRVVPTAIEFWHSRPSRLHDRLLFTRDAPGGAWALQRLSP